jgi:uncharacterized membrane protein (UPF0127 family)
MPTLKVIAVAAVVAVVFIAGYEVYILSLPTGAVTTGVPSSFTVDGKTYTFNYTATTQPERAKGLMNTTVTSSTTMLFAFPSYGIWSFWMYDTNTSLDMIWLNATGSTAKVVYLVTGAPPCYNSGACAIYTPGSAANYVIEARAGFASANGISVGSTIELG